MTATRGTYVNPTASGVGTTPVEARIGQAGLFTPDGDLGVAPGVLSGLVVTGVASGWMYQVTPGHAVTTRGATDGAVLMGNDGNVNTPTPVLADGVTPGSTAAPVSGSRWEIIWIRQRDVLAADADNNAVIGVTQGTAAGTPIRPTIPVGALALYEALIPTGAANTAAGTVTITPVATKTGLRGGIIAVPNATVRDRLNPFATDQLDTNTLYRNVGAGWLPIASLKATGSATPGSGWNPFHSALSRQNGIATFLFRFDRASGVAVQGETFAVLPSGFWPSAGIFVPNTMFNGTWLPGLFALNPDGALTVNLAGLTGVSSVAGSISWPVA
jgi:hypothetical protein